MTKAELLREKKQLQEEVDGLRDELARLREDYGDSRESIATAEYLLTDLRKRYEQVCAAGNWAQQAAQRQERTIDCLLQFATFGFAQCPKCGKAWRNDSTPRGEAELRLCSDCREEIELDGMCDDASTLCYQIRATWARKDS